MLDWKGLLKWSITNSDGTQKKDIKPMDEETKKWLMEALAEHALQDVKKMQEILSRVHEDEKGTQDDENEKIALLEELEDIVDNLDMADSLYHIGGLVELIRQAKESKYPRVQHVSLSIFITCNQNNPHIQQWSVVEGAFQFLNIILNTDNMKTKEWALAAISSLIRGENLQSKRDFIEIEGIQFNLDILKDKTGKYSDKMKAKALTMLKDLVFYDHRLHFTYNNLDSFSNTNAKVVNGKSSQLIKTNNSEKNNQVSYDQNEELKQENEKPENVKYKDCVKKYLIEQNFINDFFFYLDSLENNLLESRVCYLDILKHILEFSPELQSQFKNEKLQILKQKMLTVMKHNSKNENLNEFEISQYKDVLVQLEKKQ
ncbi:hypothetical protein ABPG72_011852 [Tetrahymena utriculariae]